MGRDGEINPKNYSLGLFGCGVTPWMFRSNGFGGFGQVGDDNRNSCVLWAEVFLWHNCGSPTFDVLWVGFSDGQHLA